MLINPKQPAVLVPGRIAALIDREIYALRVRKRGTDPEASKVLEELRVAALAWRGSATGTEDDNSAEPVSSSRWLTTKAAAELLGITPRAVRKAIALGRLPAEREGRSYRIRREDLEHYRAARAARKDTPWSHR